MDLPANTRFCFLRDQEPLTDTEFRLATKQCERIRSLIESRGDDLPQGIWSGTDPELYSSTRAVLDGEYDTINNLRLFAQNFTGYQLSSLSNAAGKPTTQPNLGTIDATLEELWRVPSKETNSTSNCMPGCELSSSQPANFSAAQIWRSRMGYRRNDCQL